MMSRKLLRDGDIWTGSWRISRRVKAGEGDKAIPKSLKYKDVDVVNKILEKVVSQKK